ncbi:MAG: hypothetical protein JWQ81_3473 [Amycolatopsis sp.]|uniref:hypothetical protein n=1 Tax=Amycolatopsis sp. TaxID=37632 RepID=UPI0026088ABD|nr:hypothetical protein [Amycolatopsis sp.]MCU1682734.1 hypothetical protein [Amycolatopsis sp.]
MTEVIDIPVQTLGRQAVLLSDSAVRRFLAAAADEYARITPDEPRPCFAVLLGTQTEAAFVIDDVAFGRNARNSDPSAHEEFTTTIVPRFGSAYENPVRAWWLDPVDLLRISRQAAKLGYDILGSIHLHPDWHRLGPESERDCPLSDRPTPMDEHMFRSSGLPVNVVCYLEQQHGGFYYSLAAWSEDCTPLPLRVDAAMPLSTKESR